jgi:hypothetical protein
MRSRNTKIVVRGLGWRSLELAAVLMKQFGIDMEDVEVNVAWRGRDLQQRANRRDNY